MADRVVLSAVSVSDRLDRLAKDPRADEETLRQLIITAAQSIRDLTHYIEVLAQDDQHNAERPNPDNLSTHRES